MATTIQWDTGALVFVLSNDGLQRYVPESRLRSLFAHDGGILSLMAQAKDSPALAIVVPNTKGYTRVGR
jgi:hypothetical protein